ncbi:MAG: hypothetical protein PHG85_00835 [Candidatus Altiarchaeota archaeon]|nr:hypothetical protein [Candidatus Altiarchaeota archaeon]
MAKKKDSGDVVEEKPVAVPVEAVEEEISEEEAAKFAFAMSPIVRVIKEELDNDKIVRRRVKEEMNLWLEKLCRKVAKKMNQSEYTVVELDDFKTAIEPYELIDDVEGERHRIVATLEKVKQDCDSLIRDVNRKFVTPDTVSLPKEPAEGGK